MRLCAKPSNIFGVLLFTFLSDIGGYVRVDLSTVQAPVFDLFQLGREQRANCY
jgi:hypothetical protein